MVYSFCSFFSDLFRGSDERVKRPKWFTLSSLRVLENGLFSILLPLVRPRRSNLAAIIWSRNITASVPTSLRARFHWTFRQSEGLPERLQPIVDLRALRHETLPQFENFQDLRTVPVAAPQVRKFIGPQEIKDEFRIAFVGLVPRSRFGANQRRIPDA